MSRALMFHVPTANLSEMKADPNFQNLGNAARITYSGDETPPLLLVDTFRASNHLWMPLILKYELIPVK